LAAAFGDEHGFEAGDIAEGVGFDLVNPHVVDDQSSWGKVDEFPSAVGHEIGVLLLHGGLLISGLGARERNAIGFRFHTVAGGEESDGGKRRTCRNVMWASNQIGHEGEFEDILLGLALFRVTTCCDTYMWVFGHVGDEVAVAEGVRP
jgi:hypothetical protein